MISSDSQQPVVAAACADILVLLSSAQVCLTTVGVLGDLCRAVEDGILPYCDDIMSVLITNLGREDVHRTIKPQILSAFGDIALVIEDRFVKYLEAVLKVLRQAMSLSIDSAKTRGGSQTSGVLSLTPRPDLDTLADRGTHRVR